MNQMSHRCSRCISIGLVVSAFLIWSEARLWASSPQASSADQKSGDALPDAPQPQSAQTPESQQPVPVPSGAAGAKAPSVKGAPVAQPAGAAVAPARQRSHRSLLIKLGLIAGAGIAVGSVAVLSQKSPARPPGASASIHP